MANILKGPGIFGTKAYLYSDITLILILVSAVLFTIGWRLAVGKRYQAHRWVQTAAVILNALTVLIVMVMSFFTNISPGIPRKLNEAAYVVPTVHAFVGIVTLALGVFVALRGNNLVPKALKFRNYKLFMRTSYALYMLATLGGVIVYIVLYV
jgi:putative membrane protein